MKFCILGPLDVLEGERQVSLGRPRTRVVLAAFLLHANEPLSRERLVDLVWGDTPPKTAAASLYNSVSQLRRALGPERLSGDAGAYRLLVAEGELDRERFEALVKDGQAALADGNAERAASLLAEALSLWRGAPLEDVRYEAFAQIEIRRLEELRLSTLEARVEADLACGRQEALVPELEALVVAHPWRERLHGQLMLALYRSGRQADALDAYGSARAALDRELGLAPSAELQALERKILQQDASLALLETAAPESLPSVGNRLIGRGRELTELTRLLEETSGRVLTLVGPGGVGKTRLALELAAASARSVVFVDLSPLLGAEQVLPSVASALGVRETGGQSLQEASVARARALGECLLVVDNCEHVLGAASELAALARSCPALRTLATSREPLHVTAEREYPLAPLAEEAAVRLFVERATSVQPAFVRDDALTFLCERLDRLPLALELAAARVKVLTPGQMLERLAPRFELLRSATRDAPARQRTLRATIEWSYELLDENEQRLFGELAVFAGGFSLEAAEAICAADVDLLGALVDKSLIDRRGGRFTLLETIRSFATDVLEQSGRASELRRHHFEYLTAPVERAYDGDPHTVIAFVEPDYENYRAALDWAIRSEPERALRLASLLAHYWFMVGMLTEGRRRLGEALERAPSTPSLERARALWLAAGYASLAGDREAARPLARESLDMARTIDDPQVLGEALRTSGWMAAEGGEYERARRLHEEAAALAKQNGDMVALRWVTIQLGIDACCLGRWEEGLTFFTEERALREEAGLPTWEMGSNIALAELRLGREPSLVAQDFADIFRHTSPHGVGLGSAGAVHGLGLTAASIGLGADAVRVLGCAAAARELLGYALELPERLVDEETVAQLRVQLGEDAFAAAWEEGRMLSADDAVALALESIRSASAIAADARV